MKNRFMLAPLTNKQSYENGKLSDKEFYWLAMRAKGQFGLTMTCASHVQVNGKGFSGQLGIFSDDHIDSHRRIAEEIKSHNSIAVTQLHHAGMRSPVELIDGNPVCPSDEPGTGSKALSLDEVVTLRDDFIRAAERANEAGYHGVEVHGAHGYILCQFLSASINKRNDIYGGSLSNRARILFEIVHGIRESCGKDFLIGVRLSPEKFGMQLSEVKTVCQELINKGEVDFLDISLWDSFKYPEEAEHQDKKLLEHFTSLDFKNVLLTVAGNIRTGKNVMEVLASGVDFVAIGRSAILHHDFPKQVINNPNFEPINLPVTIEHLISEGLSDNFIDFMSTWPGFVTK
tara:strand:+ start:1094 stop:2125 length:1032 start_codon:yes stop_codon:yes gene_type:complete